MKNQQTKTNIALPQQMPEAAATAEQLLKLSIVANEISFEIKASEARTADLKSKLAEVRRNYADLKPKALGVLAALEGA